MEQITSPHILLADDDIGVRTAIPLLFKRAGYRVTCVETPKEALFFLDDCAVDLVIMDMNYSRKTTGEEGLFLLENLRRRYPNLPVILITAWGSIELAVKGMQMGAFDFITKPWDNRKLIQSVANALELNRPAPEASPSEEIDRLSLFDKIIGRSEAMVALLNTVLRIAPTTASVLIEGESGTGKELIAEAIHQHSQRKGKPFVKVNLGGISSSLFESEMFGHKRGAFTDAVAERVGRFKLADGGTIFLDEIGELDLASQVKLLRVLQENTFEVLGESKPTRVDVRVVSATNAPLKEMIANGHFREDLYYRINLIVLRVPPLRERRDDIPLLVAHFAQELCRANALPSVRFAADAMERLMALPYPGNIRELKNLVERTIFLSGHEVITAADIAVEGCATAVAHYSNAGSTLETMEADAIREQLQQHQGNCSKVARALGISRGALYRRIEKYGIDLNVYDRP